MRVEAILFDLDGVLIDSMDLHKDAFNTILNEFGINVRVQDVAGRKTEEILKQFLHKDDLTEEEFRKLIKRKRSIATKSLNERGDSAITKDAKVIIPELAKDRKLAICTSGSVENIDFFLKHTNLKEYFSLYLTRSDIKHGKPNPEIYNLACQRLKIHPNSAIAVEDSLAGCASAYAANVNLVIYRNEISPSSGDFPGSSEISELKDLLHYV
jgi:HAD superfamily hydrolase (TIGR01509 family)